MSVVSRIIDDCRVCGSRDLVALLSLGELYISDFPKEDEQDKAAKAPLELVLCNAKTGGCGLVQLRHTVSHEAMYRNYWYRSGMNKTMTDELATITRAIESMASLSEGDLVVDIGANDGTLLRSYHIPGLTTVGFEPARNLEQYGSRNTSKIIVDFFNAQAFVAHYGNRRARAITAIAMFYDLDDPNAFVRDVVACLDDDGIFVIQMMYLPSFLRRNAFDGICHEHLEYYSLFALENLLVRHGLEVCDIEMREEVNEGSFRVYIRKRGYGANLRLRSGSEDRIRAVRDEERLMGIDGRAVYDAFADRVHALKARVYDFIRTEARSGKKIYAYGASTKGNTLLQFFGIDKSIVLAAAERNSDKWGRQTVGTGIPIVSEAVARSDNPDYFLVLPWHFMSEFKERESDFLKKGGKFIAPLPDFRIIES